MTPKAPSAPGPDPVLPDFIVIMTVRGGDVMILDVAEIEGRIWVEIAPCSLKAKFPINLHPFLRETPNIRGFRDLRCGGGVLFLLGGTLIRKPWVVFTRTVDTSSKYLSRLILFRGLVTTVKAFSPPVFCTCLPGRGKSSGPTSQKLCQPHCSALPSSGLAISSCSVQ